MIVRRLVALRSEHTTPRLSCGEAPVSGFDEVVLRAVPAHAAPGAFPELHLGWWRSDTYDPYALDRLLGDAADGPLRPFIVRAANSSELHLELPPLLTRLQARLPTRNDASRNSAFDALLRSHLQLHDLSLPLVRADFVHALDVWQWVLRLDRHASAEVQAAALLHDLERLESEATTRIEHLAPDYQAFKDAHARVGAGMAERLLKAIKWEPERIARVVHLVCSHERPDGDPERALLNDADGLSFFSVNSAGFLDWYGEVHTRRKITWTLNRMSASARARAFDLRMRPDLERMVRAVAAETSESDVRATSECP